MAENVKVAVGHPTVTGKSIVAFQLSLDNLEKRVCWLSPNEYIFKTQLENLAAANGGEILVNIFFYAYAKLLLLIDVDMESIQPDYIVFCTNKEHMDEMIVLVADWFYKVDQKIHVYSAYSNDAGASPYSRRVPETI